MCIFCVPEKLDKTSIDFVKIMHEKYYVPLIALVDEMDALRTRKHFSRKQCNRCCLKDYCRKNCRIELTYFLGVLHEVF